MQLAETAPSSPAESFANLLASLTAPQETTAESPDLSALADDFATISYERALQCSARLNPTASPGRNSGPVATPKFVANHPARESTPRPLIVTLRLSQAESAQLRERAAEAGLTVSAYIRSCIFEAETLRSQVKEALSQFRSAASPVRKDKRETAHSPKWRNRLFSLW